jgi:hypothetical protein
MNETSNTPTGIERPPMRRRLVRALRFWSFLCASLLTLLALCWTVENWRGVRAWSAVKRDLAARGEPLSMEQLLPAMPAEQENFASTPLLRGLLEYYPPGEPRREQGFWLNPHVLARVSAINLPPTRVPRAGRSSGPSDADDARSGSDGRIDLRPYALGVRLRPRTCPGNLDPSLAERYGYLPPGVKWKKPTNELEIAASITDPAQEILDYLQRFEPELQEIAEAARRPHSQFAVHWEEDYHLLLPHLAPLKQLNILFWVRAAARLRKQDTAGAFADAVTCFRMAHALRTEPLLISQLVEIGQHAFAVKALWEGLASQQWNAEKLAAFQTELARFNFQQQLTSALRGERIAQNSFLDRFNERRLSVDAISSGDTEPGPMALLLPWVPGWIRQNQVRVNRYDDLELRQLMDARWPVNLVSALDQDAALRSAGLNQNNPYTLLAHMLTPDLAKAQAKAARAQSLNQLALVACALERVRLEHGAYPKELSELTARELPGSIRDPMSGAPLRYERSADQSPGSAAGFKLWSVGLNGRDDGGIMPEKNNEAHNDARGDWVWPNLIMEKPPLR